MITTPEKEIPFSFSPLLTKEGGWGGGLVILVVLFFLVAFPAFAQDSGLVICGIGEANPCTICDIWALANKVINFILFTLATPILIIVLIAGGFIYLTSGGNPKKTETAKGLITSAIAGIIIAFAAWLIVDTILKTLVNEKFTIAWKEIKECPKPLEPNIPDIEEAKKRLEQLKIVPAQGTYSDLEARNLLSLAGIGINKENCQSSLQTNCTSLDGIPKSTVNYLLELDRRCDSNQTCRFMITGGTEAGHATHGINKPVVDMVPWVFGPDGKSRAPTSQEYKTLRDMAKSSGAITSKTFCETPSDQISIDCTGADHIHVEFP